MLDVLCRNVRCRTIAGWLAVTLLAGCQSGSTVSPVAGPSRTIDHAKGKTQVPISPQRIVVLDTAALDASLALGIKPVGTIVYGELPEYLGDQVDGIEIVGNGNEPNLETILTLKPDLVLGSKIGTGKLYRQLSQIAPTVLTEGSGRSGDWPENLQLYAEALGKPQAAEQLLQAYQYRVKQLQTKLKEPQAIEISVLSTYSDRIGAYTTGSFSGSVLEDIGLARNSSQSATWRYAVELSREALDTLDGDYLFFIYSPSFSDVTTSDFVADPIWSQLEAVKQERVCEVSGEVWAAGRSILAAQQILADVEECLK
ncbi:MAG: iron-siderophore ABC transporter substrate-binding protein [Cyanobacteria bacterium P01_F01_bin.13]